MLGKQSQKVKKNFTMKQTIDKKLLDNAKWAALNTRVENEDEMFSNFSICSRSTTAVLSYSIGVMTAAGNISEEQVEQAGLKNLNTSALSAATEEATVLDVSSEEDEMEIVSWQAEVAVVEYQRLLDRTGEPLLDLSATTWEAQANE